MRLSIPRAAGLLVAAGALFTTSSASAFVRTLGCNAEGDVCSELFWPTNCADFLIDATAEAKSGIPIEIIQQELDASFAAWDEIDCSYLTITDSGVVSGLSVGFDDDGEEDNLITFIDQGWLDLPGGGHQQGAIALTSVFFDPETGVIVNADMEFNAEFFEPTVAGLIGPDPLDTRINADLRNTITHEAGHFIGLDHSPLSDATMFAVADPGELNKRDLSQDDIDGICAIYPLADDPGRCEPAGFLPRRRLRDCTVGAPMPEGDPSLIMVGLLFGASLIVLSRRRK